MDVWSFRQVARVLVAVVAVAVLLGGQPPEIGAQQPIGPDPKIGPEIAPALQSQSRVRVIAALADPRPLNARSAAPLEPAARRAEVASVRSSVISSLSSSDFQETVQFQSVPAVAGLANAAGIQALARHPGVVKVDLDVGGTGSLAQSVPLVGGDDWHTRGNRGQGVVVAVLDSGLDAAHQDVNDGLIAEACFLNAGPGGKCPNGTDRQTGAGSAADDHNHGTWVTGVIASNGVHASEGMAPDAQYVAVKVLDNNNAFQSTADVIAALDWVFTNQPNVQVINMSLGTAAQFTGNCDNANAFTMAFAASINALRTRAPTPALTVVSSGNNGSATQMQAPACISTALSVGSTTKTDTISGFSNASTNLDLLAPGDDIVTSQRGGTTNTVDGTSFAAPHVTGCAALLISVGEAVTPAQLETRLTTSATQITDTRPGNGQTYPRLDCTPPPPGVTVSQTGGTTAVVEGGATDTFSVVLNNRPVSNVTVTLNPGPQVTTAPSPLVFTNANWNVPQVVTVTAVDDAVVEGPHNGTIALTTSSADSGYNLLAIPSVNVAITDNDTAGVTVTQSGGTTAVTEGGATDSFTVVLTSQPTANVSVALNPGPQVTTVPSPLVFTAANWNVPQAVTVTAVDDATAEGTHNETVGFTVSSTDPLYNNAAVASVAVSITDNDVAGLAVNDPPAVTEGDTGTSTLTFTVTLAPPSALGGTVQYATADGPAPNGATGAAACAANVDYLTASGTLTFGPLETSKTITVTVCPDPTLEGNETVLVNLSGPTNGLVIADGQGAGTITNDDTGGTLTWSASSVSVPELAGSVTIAVQRTGVGPAGAAASPAAATVPAGNVPGGSVRPNPSPTANQTASGVTFQPAALAAVSVSYATANGTAQAGQDFAASSGTISFGVNETTKTIVVPILNDGLLEGNEVFTVTLSNPTGGAALGQPATVTVTIQDTTHAVPTDSPGDDSADDEREERERETEEERRQRARTNQGNKDDDSVEGDVIETRCDLAWPAVVIANRDGAVEVKLLKPEAQNACSSIQVGDYLEADGEKQHEQLFHADSVEIKRRR